MHPSTDSVAAGGESPVPRDRLAAADSPERLRVALAGVRALVLDADGVIVIKGSPLPGAIGALERLATLGLPYRVVTNFSTSHRDSLAARMRQDGVPADAVRIITAASAAAAHTAARYPGQPLFVLAARDALREFEGQRLLTSAEADAADAAAAAVVIGDAGDDLTYRNLDIAFRLIRGGAHFVAMHRNPWWFTARGPTLDSGALVAGLEFATGRRALVTGKPSPAIFRVALDELRAETGEPRLRAGDVAMVGDDVRADVLAAKRVGMRGVLVLTGKHGPSDLAEARIRRGGGAPDAVAPSLADVVAALD